jgi:aminoglycoside phosphotransferase (APT) family kinase protein
MAGQFQLYAVVHGTPGAPPVPSVTYYCDDISVLGDPFYLMERVNGTELPEQSTPAWIADPPDSFREDMSRQFVSAFASLHRLPPLELLGPIRSPLDEMRRWRGYAENAGDTSLMESIDRLMAIPVRTSGHPSPVHGDPKPGNTMWNDGKLQAVLDWEMAFNGEALTDLGYSLGFLEGDLHPALTNFGLPGMWRRNRVIAEWERYTGRSAEGVEWFEAAAMAKLSAINAFSYHLARTGKNSDPRFAAMKAVNDQIFLPWLAKTLERAEKTATRGRP